MNACQHCSVLYCEGKGIAMVSPPSMSPAVSLKNQIENLYNRRDASSYQVLVPKKKVIVILYTS
jgi:hypothetical protein